MLTLIGMLFALLLFLMTKNEVINLPFINKVEPTTATLITGAIVTLLGWFSVTVLVIYMIFLKESEKN